MDQHQTSIDGLVSDNTLIGSAPLGASSGSVASGSVANGAPEKRPAFLPPGPVGLYDPAFEHDACGVGFVAHIKGQRSHQIVADADRILRHMNHRGACGCEENTGDGAGML